MRILFDDELQKEIKKGKLLTRKDMVIGGEDIIIYRSEEEFGTHGTEIKTLYKSSDNISLFKYQYEKTGSRCFGFDDDTYRVNPKDGEDIEKIINNNMKKLKGLGKLEERGTITMDGGLTELYFSDGKQGVFFKHSWDNDSNGKNMKTLLNIQNKIEKIIASIEKDSKSRFQENWHERLKRYTEEISSLQKKSKNKNLSQFEKLELMFKVGEKLNTLIRVSNKKLRGPDHIFKEIWNINPDLDRNFLTSGLRIYNIYSNIKHKKEIERELSGLTSYGAFEKSLPILDSKEFPLSEGEKRELYGILCSKGPANKIMKLIRDFSKKRIENRILDFIQENKSLKRVEKKIIGGKVYEKIITINKAGYYTIENRIDGILNGEYLHYNEHGILIGQDNYVDGKKEGECVTYFNDGFGGYSSKTIYKNGKENGKSIRYNGNGTIFSVVNCRNGKPTGKIYGYYNNGKLRMEGQYKNGLPEGKRISYNKNGSIKSKGTRKKGI